MLDVVGKIKIYLGISGLLVAASLVLIFVLGLRPGIDLSGGASWQVAFEEEVSLGELREIFPRVLSAGDGSFILRLSETDEETHQRYASELQAKFGNFEELNFSSIGPTIGAELRTRAIWAIVLVMAFISFYIAAAFRKVSEPIKSWKYGVVTLVTLFHDVSIPAGMLAVLGYLRGIEIDTNFIVALLVVMGFSVHDTIVVFDRIRENLILHREKRVPLGELVNVSVRSTLARSVNTSLTLVFVLLALLFLGPPSIFYFILTILVGVLVGTYSSIYVASPLLTLFAKYAKVK
ncbi:MAG: protein translocase subunit SecF [Candidatus Brennerbacteria bacterium]|nr:protein translocase subunit SecF [Candidatus Brennerbacteria bacterium]